MILLRSSETQFECLASWREGRNNFLVGKMEHSHINKDEERFRCIMWDQETDQEGEMITYMSISGEASCNGLYSSREGQTLVLRAGEASLTLTEWPVIFLWIFSVNKDSLCSLPSWLRHGKVWQSLDLKLKLEISESQVSDEYFLTAIVCYCSHQTKHKPPSAPVCLQGINPWLAGYSFES